jgi:antitoxin (DNA-binding transcriptional repressor) of toxin-antitoxin stability system
MTEVRLNIHDAKTHLSRYLNELGHDDRIVLCRRNQPVAEIRLLPLSPQEIQPRRLGLAEGDFVVDESFFEPLPNEMLDVFEGKS